MVDNIKVQKAMGVLNTPKEAVEEPEQEEQVAPIQRPVDGYHRQVAVQEIRQRTESISTAKTVLGFYKHRVDDIISLYESLGLQYNVGRVMQSELDNLLDLLK